MRNIKLMGLFGLLMAIGLALVWGAENSSKSSMKMDDAQKTAKKQNKAFSDWLDKLKARINNSKAKHNKIVAVASVRGAKAEDPVPLYWKGKEGEAKIDMDELKKFESAIDLANSGKMAEAKTSLESFITSYPKSPLVADAKETLAMMPQETPAPPTEAEKTQ